MSTLLANGTNGWMTVNGRFAPISGEPATEEQYEHGVQVIDQDKQFK
jgi:hypothetical protein